MASPSEILPIAQIVIQTTSLCNLNCNYCYLSENDRKVQNSFPSELIEPVFSNIFSSPYLSKRLNIVWHLGEPLTNTVEYYETFINKIDLLKDTHGQSELIVDYRIQTNGTLINQKWCDFFKKHKIQVGISCDGPQGLHDSHRRDWSNNGTFKKMLDGVRLLYENGIKYNAIAVVTESTLRSSPYEFYEFFAENHFSGISVNPVEQTVFHTENWLDNDTSKELFTSFLKGLIKAVQNTKHEKPPIIRSFREMYSQLFRIPRPNDLSTSVSDPLSIITIDYLGNFSTLSPEMLPLKSVRYGDFILGNLANDSLDSVVKSDKFKSIMKDLETGKENCWNSCEYYSVCGGGEPANKVAEHDSLESTETTFCIYNIKLLADTLLESVESPEIYTSKVS